MIGHDNINGVFQPKQFYYSESMVQQQCIGKQIYRIREAKKLTSIFLLNHLTIKKDQLRSKAWTLVFADFYFCHLLYQTRVSPRVYVFCSELFWEYRIYKFMTPAALCHTKWRCAETLCCEIETVIASSCCTLDNESL